MIPTRTKQISVYGKRSKRVVAASPQDMTPDVSEKLDKLIHRMKKRENGSETVKSVTKSRQSSSPRVLSLSKQRTLPNASSTRNGVKQRMRLAEILAQETTRYPISGLHEQEDYNKESTPVALSKRMPLSSLSTNVANSPSSVRVSAKPLKKKEGSPKRLITSKALSTVQMDIRVVDAKGKVIEQEQRTARIDAIASHVHKPSRTFGVVATHKHHFVPSPSVPAIAVGSSVDAASGHLVTLPNSSLMVNDTEVLTVEPQNRHRPRRALTNVILSDDENEQKEGTEHEAMYLPPETPPPPLSESSRSLLIQTQTSMLPEAKVIAPAYLRALPKVEVVIPPASDRVQLKRASQLPFSQNIQSQNGAVSFVTSSKTRRPLHAKLLDISTSETMIQARIPSRYPLAAYKTSYDLIPSPLPKPRQLTPIRRSQNKGSTAKNSLFAYGRGVPPSPTTPTGTDSDLSFEFSQIDIGISREEFEALRLHDTDSRNDYPEFLRALLEECRQETCGPYEFSAFIKSFPFDPILRDPRKVPGRNSGEVLRFSKIGEASYSEVFGIGGVVLKVIPLCDESRPEKVKEEVNEVNGPAPSDVKDVRKEIIVTRAMGEVHEGFVKLLKTYIVRGKYPDVLLKLWDEYNERKGSESVRPDTFTPSQTYAIIVLPNDGPDLEAYTFSNASKTGWRKASSLFWQVTKALAHAEELVSFEHRDLHWGQILVKDVDISTSTQMTPPRPTADKLNQSQGKNMPIFMDDQEHGVQATIIDLGLSRMDGSKGVHWTPFDEEVFTGEGDYQFDVYRLMKEYTGSDWKGYHPLTNVMWLHYLVTKLLRHKNLRAPVPRKFRLSTITRTSVEPPHILQDIKTTRVNRVASDVRFTERDCYDSLIDIEDWLWRCITEAVPRVIQKSRGKGRTNKTIAVVPTALTSTMMCSCAGQVVIYGVKRGWIRPVLD